MSEDMIALIVTTIIIALALVWVPMLNLICPPCGRALDRLRRSKTSEENTSAPSSAVRISGPVR